MGARTAAAEKRMDTELAVLALESVRLIKLFYFTVVEACERRLRTREGRRETGRTRAYCEAGHTRALDRKCHVLALGSAWVEQTATITSSVRRPLHGASAGRAVPRLRRLWAAPL